MKSGIAKYVALMVALLANVPAGAASPSFQITRVFSNLDGTHQFIQLQETAGLNGQHHFAGLTLTSTHNGITKQITFPVDLPDDQTANQSVLIATSPGVSYYNDQLPAYGEIGYFAPDFVIPIRFLPTNGGTIDFAGVDQVTYPQLPYDGWRGWLRNGTFGAPPFSGFHREPPRLNDPSVPVAQEGVSAIEYYNAALDHYFVTAFAWEIDAIESGRLPGWVPTANTIPVQGGLIIYGVPDASLVPDGVCRFYIPANEGDSHFYSASSDECAIARVRFPEYFEETGAAFYVRLPDPQTGVCPIVPGTYPPWRLTAVFRLWNQRFDSNHRYTTDPILRNFMIQKGYVSEGYGPFGVAFCVF